MAIPGNGVTVGSFSSGESSSDTSMTSVPSGSSPVAVAWLFTKPSVMLASVMV